MQLLQLLIPIITLIICTNCFKIIGFNKNKIISLQWLGYKVKKAKIIQTREAAVIQARKKLSAMSAAKAAVDHMHDWWFGTADGAWVSMGIISDGSYGVPKGLIYSMPVTIYKKQWTIVQGLKITSFAKNKLDLAAKELLYEKEEALEVCNPCCVLLLPDCKT